MVASADAVEIDGIYYNLITGTKTAAVIKKPSGKYTGTVVIPASVTYDDVTYSVTIIRESAFQYCSGLTSITIPNSVTYIGENAFRNCTGLTSITIPNSVTSIWDYAFQYCSGLTSITIPNSVKYIGYGAFRECSGLTSIVVENGNTTYDSRNNCNALIETSKNTLIAGCKNTVIPNSVTSIGNRAFKDCSSLTSITIPNSVTNIGECAFNGCTGLTSVTIGNSVTNIGECAFQGCSGLTSVTIPNSVTSIKSFAFDGCTGLTSVTIPNSVTSIGVGAFRECSGLTSIVVENGNTTYDSRNNYNALIETSTNTLIVGCKNTVIPNSVTSIGWYAFYGCTGLTSITIPNSVTSIGSSAFYRCSGLTDLYCYAEQVPTTESYVFYKTPVDGATLHVPAASIDAYKAADPWKEFGTIVALTPEETCIKSVTATGDPSDCKFMENGRLIIRKNGQRYNAAGQMVKEK